MKSREWLLLRNKPPSIENGASKRQVRIKKELLLKNKNFEIESKA